MEWATNSADETFLLGHQVLAHIQRGDKLFFSGPLGVRKTLLVSGIVAAAGGDWRDVASPTYGLISEYQTPTGLIIHADLYRLGCPEDVYDLGLDNLPSEATICVEWAERAQGLLGSGDWIVTFRETGPESRQISLDPYS